MLLPSSSYQGGLASVPLSSFPISLSARLRHPPAGASLTNAYSYNTFKHSQWIPTHPTFEATKRKDTHVQTGYVLGEESSKHVLNINESDTSVLVGPETLSHGIVLDLKSVEAPGVL